MSTFSALQTGPKGHEASQAVLYQNHDLNIGRKKAEDFVAGLNQGLPSVLDLGGELPPFVAFNEESISRTYKNTISVEGEALQVDPSQARITFFENSLFQQGVAYLLGREVTVTARLSIAIPPRSITEY